MRWRLGAACQTEDAPELAFAHAVKKCVREIAASVEIQCHTLIPFCTRPVSLERPRAARIVHKNIKPAELSDHRDLDALGGTLIRDVLQQDQGTFVATRLDLIGDSFEWLFPARQDREFTAF